MRPSSRRAIARNTAARPSPQTRCGWDNYPACRTHLPPATHRLTAKRSACFSRFHLSNYFRVPAPAESLVNTELTGFFTKNSAKVHSGPDNQRQSQNAANPRDSPHCGLPRTALAQKSANAFLLPLFSSSAEPEKPPKICPKTARNPSPGQGRRPAPKEVTQRLAEANMGVHWSVLPAVAAPAGVPLRKPAVGSVAP